MTTIKPLTCYFTGINAMIGIFFALTLISCDEDDPVREETPELITRASIVFTPEDVGEPVVVSATDPDGEGVQGLTVEGNIDLLKNSTYNLDIYLFNDLAEPDPEDISAEVAEEAEEHMFFYSWTGNVFSEPSGDGNIDNRGDEVRYEDEDANGLPLGLQTLWTTSASEASGKFRIILKHQPGLKSATSTASDGETDEDITWDVKVE